MSITLTGRELVDLMGITGLVDSFAGGGELDTEYTIEDCPSVGVRNDSGEHEHYRLVAYNAEYPEEGVMPLGEKLTQNEYDLSKHQEHIPPSSYYEAKPGSCTCLTKSDDPEHHQPLCHYRLLCERESGLGLPWIQLYHQGWRIVGMNHYNLQGIGRLFCSMVRDGSCITAEGIDQGKVFYDLLYKANHSL